MNRKAIYISAVFILMMLTAVDVSCQGALSWGNNNKGQLGDGGGPFSSVPVQVTDLADAVSVAAGSSFSVALRSDGTVVTWGENYRGQLGNGTTSFSNVPLPVSDLTGVTAVSAGWSHSVALKSDKTVWAWGWHRGSETEPISYTPVKIAGLENVKAISAWASRTMVLKEDGTVWGWGENNDGVLGTGNGTSSNVPVQAVGLEDVQKIAAGTVFSMALKTNGTVWVWGSNGILGDGTNNYSFIPVQVPGLSDVIDIAACPATCVVLKSDGTVWAWGNNDYGTLGNGTTVSSLAPVQITALPAISDIGAGGIFCFARESGGTIWAWGDNTWGEMGNGTTHYSHVPAVVDNFEGFEIPDGGSDHTLALKGDGTVWACGGNESGQLGNGKGLFAKIPGAVIDLSGIKKISGGENFSLALKYDGTVWAWGESSDGQLGNGDCEQANIPAQVQGLGNITDIAAGGNHSLALDSSGNVWAWGDNELGQVGDGGYLDVHSPVQITDLSGVVQIAAGYEHSVAMMSDGKVWSWGSNEFGQLGIDPGSLDSSNIPVYSYQRSADSKISAGYYHTIELRSNGTVWSWGKNTSGQLGNGWNISVYYPVPAQGMSNIVEVEGGYGHTVALAGDGTVWTWGKNGRGQLGIGSNIDSNVPVHIQYFSGITGISAGGDHSIAMDSSGDVWAWGDNDYGQIGDDTLVSRDEPVDIAASGCVIALGSGRYHSLAVTYPEITVLPGSLAGVIINEVFGQALSAGGGSAPYSFSLTGGALPTGLTLSAEGTISGTPTSAGSFTFEVTAEDANGFSGKRSYCLAVNEVGCGAMDMTPDLLPDGFAASYYSHAVAAEGGTPPYAYAVTSGTLHDGLELSAGGIISGTPIVTGTRNVTITATDSQGCVSGRSYPLSVDCPEIALMPEAMPGGTAGTAYSQVLSASGGIAPYSYSVIKGVLPPGIVLNSATGEISGTPSIHGDFEFTVLTEDVNGCSLRRGYLIATVCPQISLSPQALAHGIYRTPYEQQITATGGVPPYTFSGSLPAGFSINPVTGIITGTPEFTRGSPISITATDSGGDCSGTGNYLFLVDCPPAVFSPASLPTGTEGVFYSQTVTAEANGFTYGNYQIFSGSLPPGLNLDPVTGVISGTPGPGGGNFNFNIVATLSENAECTQRKAYSLQVDGAPTAPVITGVIDCDTSCSLRITFTPGWLAEHHDLWIDGVQSATSITSAYYHHPGDTASHSYVIRAVRESSYLDSAPVLGADPNCVTMPLEIATGLSCPDDCQSWNEEKTVQSWPTVTDASGYRLYRGIQSDLANLLGREDNCCIRYTGTQTSADLSSDDPGAVPGGFYWYIVTAYNSNGGGETGAGEATEGARHINPLPSCQ